MSGKSGIGTFIDGILLYILKQTHNFLLIGTPKINIEKKDNITIIPCDISPFSLQELFHFPKNILKQINSYDVYFTPYCNIPNGIKIPIYSTIHDILFLDMPNIAGKAGTFIRRMFYQRAINKSKAIFTVSLFSKSRIIKQLKCKKTIYVVYNGIPAYYEEQRNKITKKEPFIIFIGNIKPHKGLQTLIPAFLKFRNKMEAEGKVIPKLLIVGTKDNFRTKDTKLESAMKNAPSDAITFTGYLSDKELIETLSKAELLVQPSLYEGFGLPPLQALATGTKVLLSDIPVFKEIYEDFPVNFFTVNDIENLANKMYESWNFSSAPDNYPNRYSYKITTEKILEAFNL